MGFDTLVFFTIFIAMAVVNGSNEGKILGSWKEQLNDSNGVLKSWDTTIGDPCTWFHLTCNLDKSVIRVDLGLSGLSGTLSPDLAQLTNLQALELFKNNLTGVIPPEFGNLKNLQMLDLYNNQLSGEIPSSLGNLKSLRFLRLNSNKLTGKLPDEINQLFKTGDLRVLNVSDNQLTGPGIGRVHFKDQKG